MKNIFYSMVLVVSCVLLTTCANDMFDNIKETVGSNDEVFVGKFDKAEGLVGFNRVEIDLSNAGRVPASKMGLGKAVKTIVEYDNQVITIDSVCSWVSITGLTEAKLYRFHIYAADEFGNRSLPVEAALIPFTDEDLENLVVPAPEKVAAPNAAELLWANGMASSFFELKRLVYSFKDANGATQTFSVEKTDGELKVPLGNLELGGKVTAKLDVICYPKQNDVAILDTVTITDSVMLDLPSNEEYLATRTPRSVRSSLILNNKPTAVFEAATEHCVFDEVRYTTTSQEEKIIRCWADAQTVECPDAALDAKFSTRTAFCPPASTDTLFTDWTQYRHLFSSFAPAGTYKVDPLSWRGNSDNTAKVPDVYPQSEYSEARNVTLTVLEPGKYRISDLFGGFYEPGRGYGEGYLSWGEFTYAGDDEFILTGSLTDPWGTGFFSISCSWDNATQTLKMTVPWGDPPDYNFNLILHKQ